MNRKFLHVQPSELKFPFQLNKLSTCWLELTSKIDQNVAFKVKTTHPKKYCVRPNVVSMQAQKDFPVPLPKDKFLVQSMIAPVGLNAEDITSEMFRKETGNDVEELKLRVVFVTADPPSPIPEVSEEEYSPEAPESETLDRRNHIMALFDSATTTAGEFQDFFFKEQHSDGEEEEQMFEASESTFEPERQLSQDWDRVSKLIEERTFLMLENHELQCEVEMIRKQIYRSTSHGNSATRLALLASFFGLVVGYVIS
ncbi:vesicle-associated protein 1-3 isoform X2 [Beta vulgaris subsp. vulgaris]|uniref:vesicle-associated protein 1-3 isoform X2 n=1 Tax=Beta vulgaris subsp. vulgaris TaxID=3555 RepID=UPI00054020C6|nr:vesicle-associated protein 1-3 isoform X2 [Beta vulgaris subsp. vulgaris]